MASRLGLAASRKAPLSVFNGRLTLPFSSSPSPSPLSHHPSLSPPGPAPASAPLPPPPHSPLPLPPLPLSSPPHPPLPVAPQHKAAGSARTRPRSAVAALQGGYRLMSSETPSQSQSQPQSQSQAQSQAQSQSQVEGPIKVDLGAAFKTHLCEPPSSVVATSREELWDVFRRMTVVRRAEIMADTLFKAQQIRGFCHLYDGQEAVCIGMEAALTPADVLITAYRDHGFYLSRNGTLEGLFGELMGRQGGCAGGKGGSMHLYNVPRGFYGGWGIVGTSAPLGAGMALAQHIMQQEALPQVHQEQQPEEQERAKRKDRAVTFAVFGDGAANQGQVYETANMAALWRLPLVLVVENNHYGMGTSEHRASAQSTFYDRFAYMPGMRIDGMDVLAVKQGTAFAKQHALEKGPMMLEFDTYRYHGHSMSDPGSTYRQRSEIQGVRSARDPIEHVRHLLVQEGGEDMAKIKAVEKEVKQEVQEAADKAKQLPQPPREELWTNVYHTKEGNIGYGADRRAALGF